MEVQKKGKSLTLYLSSGNMFFNVEDPLKSGETFSIKTSTMTTGIRGTSGCVRVINDRVTEVHLLTGQVEIYTENPSENELNFRYSREERLKNAPEIVKKYYAGELPTAPKGFFNT